MASSNSYTVQLSVGEKEIKITRKKMKSIRMRVDEQGTISVSAPLKESAVRIEGFIESHKPWLEKALAKIELKPPLKSEESLANGSKTRIIGEEYTICITMNPKSFVTIDKERKILCIGVKNVGDDKAVQTAYDKWWRENAKTEFTAVVEKYMPIFTPYNVSFPEISVTKMKSRWGSCMCSKAKINLNFYLYRAPYACMEYVVLHELTHFLNPTHQKSFYGFIEKYMPDWKQRRNLLKLERTS